jgi:hypothetical protein
MRIVGKNLDAEEADMARAVTDHAQGLNTAAAWAIGLLIFFPILWTILTSFKTEATGDRRPAAVPVLRLDAGKLRRGAGALDYMRFLWNSVIIAGRLDPSGHHHRGPGRLVDGLRALEADQGHPAVDAVDQDAAGGRRALPDLPDLHRARPARQPGWLVASC